jgi:hypothetical protein
LRMIIWSTIANKTIRWKKGGELEEKTMRVLIFNPRNI